MKQGKVWGNTELIILNEVFEVHRIDVVKGGYCSKHIHRYKYNMFYVEKGELQINIWKNDYDLIDKTILGPGEKIAVPPNEYHRFYALKDTIAYEIYYTVPIHSDIQRIGVGGVK